MTNRILIGDCREQLATLPEKSVHCCVTSPPYWALRSYLDADHPDKCYELGCEPTPEEYVANMVDVFRAVWRVLRDDGVLWLNLGDSFCSGGREGHGTRVGYKQQTNRGMCGENDPVRAPQPPGLKPKDLVGIPWRVAFALQADGWYLRSDVIWAKPNPMPESVTDRPTKAHEYLFMLTKSARYYYDAEAVKEPCQSGPSNIRKMQEQRPRIGGLTKDVDAPLNAANRDTNIGQKRGVGDPSGRNRRSVWTIATEPFSGAHFATFPRKLIEPCILAGTSAKGCCPSCGAPWQRVVEKQSSPRDYDSPVRRGNENGWQPSCGNVGLRPDHEVHTRTVGWRPTCDCDAGDPIPCTVLDPFLGSGTTACVAIEHGRAWVGCELNAEYVEIAEQRIAKQRAGLGLFADIGLPAA